MRLTRVEVKKGYDLCWSDCVFLYYMTGHVFKDAAFYS
jgi:hypothetical protein